MVKIRGMTKVGNKLNEKKFAFSLAGTFGVIYILCAILIAIFPAGMVKAFGFLFHGIDISRIAEESLPFIDTILGLIEIIALSLIVGYIFAKIYNMIKD